MFLKLSIKISTAFALGLIASSEAAFADSVTQFALYDANSDQPISIYNPIPNGAVIDLNSLPSAALSVRAITYPAIVGSVKFTHNGVSRTENLAPYTSAGGTGENDTPDSTLVEGVHNFTATPYTGSSLSGSAGTSASVSFTLVRRTSTPYRVITLPGRIEAADFDQGAAGVAYWDADAGNNGNYRDRGGDVDLEISSDGTPDVGWIADGEFLQYTVDVSATGDYALSANVASPGSAGLFDILVDGTVVANDIAVPNTGGWQNYSDVRAGSVRLSAGQHVFRFVAVRGGFNFNHLDASASSSSSPYRTINVPGRVQAEDFDNGGQGISYSDATSGNSGDYSGRGESVDLQMSSDGTPNVGWIDSGEWLKYTINVTAAGNYDLAVRVASAWGSGGIFNLELDGVVVMDHAAAPNTGDWQNYRDVTRSGVYFGAGQHQLRFVAVQGGFNFNHIDISAPSSSTVVNGSLRILEWNVQFGSNPDAQAQFIAGQNPDVIILTETPGDGTLYRDLIQQYTGRTWYLGFNYGLAMLSRIQPSAIENRSLGANSWGAYRPAVRMAIPVGGTTLNVFGVHLDYPNEQYLQENMDNLLAWAGSISGRKLIGGDFNAYPIGPGGNDTQRRVIDQLRVDYVDACPEIMGSDEVCMNYPTQDSNTRLDAFYRSRSGIRARSYQVYYPGLSDHRPIVAVYDLF